MEIEETTNQKPKAVTGNNRFSFTIEAASKIKAQNLHQITEVEHFSCTVTFHPRFNYCKGIIYIYECNIEEIDEFRDYLREKYNVMEIQPATFIKKTKTKAFVVTFIEDESLHSLYITRERQATKVYSFGKRSILCNNCQAYGHTRKWCNRNIVCRKCGTVGHGMDNCNASESHCYHCEGEHMAGSRECDKQKTDEVLLNI